ncbi:hypothetical protein LTR28_006197, partial [Elasticomyces elasticus]
AAATSRHTTLSNPTPGPGNAPIRYHGLGGSATLLESGRDETAAATAVARTAAAAAFGAPAEYTHYGEYAGRAEGVRVPGFL